MGSHDCPGTSSQLAYRRHIDRIRSVRPVEAHRKAAPADSRDQPGSLASLQATVGNRAVVQLLTSVQRDTPKPPAPAPSTSPTAAGPEQKPPADARDWAKSAIDKLPKTQKERFEAIAWGVLDFPDTVVPVAKRTKEQADWLRKQPSVTEVEDPKGNYFKGDNQAEAQELLKALAKATSGKGERRINSGPTAVLKERAFKLDKEDFDAFFVDKLDSEKFDGQQVNTSAAVKLKEMKAAAKKDKVTLTVGSAYRSRAKEEAKAKEIKNRKAFAGFSPHSMGLAIDFNLKTKGYDYVEQDTGNFNKVLDMLESPVYKWLSAHASEYGFYPYSQEPWHWEYNPDDDFATKFFDSDETLKAKIKEADDAEAAEIKAKADQKAAEKAARAKKGKGAKAKK